MEPNKNDKAQNDCLGESCDCCESGRSYTFKELFIDFIAGTPIKRKSWRGYWRYRFGEIEMHSKDGTVTKFSETKDVLFTLAGILQNDWEVAYNYNCDVPVK